MVQSKGLKGDIARLRSDVRKLISEKSKKQDVAAVTSKNLNPYTGLVTGNYWTQSGMPWVSSEARKAVMTEYYWQPIRGQPRRVDTAELRQFAQSFWVEACLTTILDEVSSVEWDIIPDEGYEFEEVIEPIQVVKKFLQHPNKNRESFTDVFIRSLLRDVYTLDAGVLVKVFTVESYDWDNLEPKSGSPTLKPKGQRELKEIYSRDGASFLKEIDKFGFESGYWQYSYQIPAHPMWFNREEVSYVMRNQRAMSPYGYSPVQSALDLVKSLHYSTLYNKRFFEETPIPDGALSVLDTNEIEMKGLMDMWERELKGQPHKFIMMNKDMKFVPFNISQRELEFLDTQKWYFKLIITSFGLSPTELGITDDANRATSMTQAELTKRKGIRPILKILENYLNEDIISEFGFHGIRFQFIYDDPAEKQVRLTNWKAELETGIKTINEVRNEMGLLEVPWGNVPNNRMSMMMGMGAGPGQGAGGGNPTDASPTTNNTKGDENGIESKKPDFKEGEDEKGKTQGGSNHTDTSAPAPPGTHLGAPGLESSPEEEHLHEEVSEAKRDADKEDEKKRGEAEDEANGKVQRPYGQDKRPVGNFRSHETDMAKKKDIIFFDKLDKKKVIDLMGVEVGGVGQYYFEQPIAQDSQMPPFIAAQRGIIDQHNFAEQTKLQSNLNQFWDEEFARQMGFTNLRELAHALISDPSLAAKFKPEDQQVVMQLVQAMSGNPNTTPNKAPHWSPKSLDKNDSDFTTKEFCGFDYTTYLDLLTTYSLSSEYLKLLMEYLDGLKPKQVKSIRNVLNLGLNQNLTIKEIAININNLINDKERSDLIARTEVIRLTNEANRQRMTNQGYEEVVFISAMEDGRLCEICRGFDGKIFSIDEAKGLIPEKTHPRCRCSLAPHMS